MTSPGGDDGGGRHPVAETGGEPVAEVFIPAQAGADGRQAQLELRQTTGGALALVLYTSLERLVECCGEHQPWMKVPTKELPAVVEQVGAQVIREDVPLPGGTRGEDG